MKFPTLVSRIEWDTKEEDSSEAIVRILWSINKAVFLAGRKYCDQSWWGWGKLGRGGAGVVSKGESGEKGYCTYNLLTSTATCSTTKPFLAEIPQFCQSRVRLLADSCETATKAKIKTCSCISVFQVTRFYNRSHYFKFKFRQFLFLTLTASNYSNLNGRRKQEEYLLFPQNVKVDQPIFSCK